MTEEPVVRMLFVFPNGRVAEAAGFSQWHSEHPFDRRLQWVSIESLTAMRGREFSHIVIDFGVAKALTDIAAMRLRDLRAQLRLPPMLWIAP
jgi:hypothetical protein